MRTAVIWLASFISAAGLVAAPLGGLIPHLGTLPESFVRAAGPYGSVNHVAFMNLVLALLVTYLAIDPSRAPSRRYG